MKTFRRFLVVAVLLILVTPTYAQLAERIKAAAAECGFTISNIKALEPADKLKSLYSEKYQLFIEQPIDHTNPAIGTFKQKVVIFHCGYNRPTVLVTEGYTSRGANPGYNNELSTMFRTNMIEVEHRYFQESIPFMQDNKEITDESLNWDYMTAKNEAAATQIFMV